MLLSPTTPVCWDDYPTMASEDCAKTDLELVHTPCGEHLCDVEAGDTVRVLADTIADHDAQCPKARAVGLPAADAYTLAGAPPTGTEGHRPSGPALARIAADPLARHVPLWMYVQTAGDGMVSFAGSGRVPAGQHPLHYGSSRQHQFLVGEMVMVPHYGIGTDALIGTGLGGIVGRGFHDLKAMVAQGEVLFDPHGLLPAARG